MKIAYVTVLPADDPHAWSGLNRSIAECLRAQGLEVILVGPVFNARRAFVSKVRAKLLQLATGRRHLWTRHLALLRSYGRDVARRLERIECDVVFSPGTEALAFLPADLRQPVVFWTDAPMGAMAGYYPWYTGLAPGCLADAMATDTAVLRRAALGCYSSAWGLEGAVTHHGARRERLAVLPFGPNFGSPTPAAAVASLAHARLQAPWRFLFVGVDWVRKGGAQAVAIVAELNRRGHPSELDVAGCTPPGPLPDFVKLHGFLNRREEAGRQRLAELFRGATFFLLPTLADATPVVFCEALAQALPCLGTRTGGLPSVVTDGVTGHLLPLAASAADYADRVVATATPARYEAMARAAQADAATRLNWGASGARLKELLAEVRRRPTHEPDPLSSVA